MDTPYFGRLKERHEKQEQFIHLRARLRMAKLQDPRHQGGSNNQGSKSWDHLVSPRDMTKHHGYVGDRTRARVRSRGPQSRPTVSVPSGRGPGQDSDEEADEGATNAGHPGSNLYNCNCWVTFHETAAAQESASAVATSGSTSPQREQTIQSRAADNGASRKYDGSEQTAKGWLDGVRGER